MSDYQCVSFCPSRYFSNFATYVCQSCPYDCYSCNSDGTCQVCNAITDYRVLDPVVLRCKPLAGYYDNAVTVCLKCPSLCLTCSSATNCLSCAGGAFLRTDNLCYDSCPIRYYANPMLSICQNCPYDCLTCNYDGTCLTCDEVGDFRQFDSVTTRCVPITGFC